MPPSPIPDAYDALTNLGSLNISLPITQHITAGLPTQRGFQNKVVDGETIGRIAFLVLEEAGKLDINQMLSLNPRIPFMDSVSEGLAPYRESWAASRFFFDILGDGTSSDMPWNGSCYELDTVRLGLQMQEARRCKIFFGVAKGILAYF